MNRPRAAAERRAELNERVAETIERRRLVFLGVRAADLPELLGPVLEEEAPAFAILNRAEWRRVQRRLRRGAR